MKFFARYARVLLICAFIFTAGCNTADIPEVTTYSSSTAAASITTQTVPAVTSRTSEATEMSSAAVDHSVLEQLLIDVHMSTNAGQIILSFQNDPDEVRKGLVFAYEITDDLKVETVFENIPVVYGRNGLDKEAEGDGRAPSGVFDIPFAFGTTVFETEPGIEYRITTEYDYWIDDTNSDEYNTWQTFNGDPKTKWKSFERLKISAYSLAFVIGYNADREKGLGSAIFFHVWKNEDTYTAGCTAASFDDVRALISWLESDKYPVIIQGSIKYFSEIYDIDIRKETADGAF